MRQMELLNKYVEVLWLKDFLAVQTVQFNDMNLVSCHFLHAYETFEIKGTFETKETTTYRTYADFVCLVHSFAVGSHKLMFYNSIKGSINLQTMLRWASRLGKWADTQLSWSSATVIRKQMHHLTASLYLKIGEFTKRWFCSFFIIRHGRQSICKQSDNTLSNVFHGVHTCLTRLYAFPP